MTHVVRPLAALLGGTVIGQGLVFAANAMVAVRLGPEQFGLVSIAQATAVIGATMTDLGLTTRGIADIARAEVPQEVVLTRVLRLRVILAFVAFGACVAYAFLGHEESITRTLIILASVHIFPYAALLEWFFQGRTSHAIVALARTIRGLVYLGSVYVLVSDASRGTEAVLAYVLGYSAASLLLVLIAGRYISLLKAIKAVFRDPWSLDHVPFALGLSMLLNQVNFNFGLLFIQDSVDAHAAGLYSSANRIALLFSSFVASSVFVVLLPLVTSRVRVSTDEALLFARRIALPMTGVAIACGSLGSVVAPTFISTVFGSEYDGAAAVLQIGIWGVALQFVRSAFDAFQLSLHRERRILGAAAAGAVMTVVLNLVLVPRMGIVGAAWSSIGAEVCMFLTVLPNRVFTIRRVSQNGHA